MASEVFSAREGDVNPLNANVIRGSNRMTKKERERQEIIQRMNSSSPQFGFPGTYETSPTGRRYRTSGKAVLPDGSYIEITSTNDKDYQVQHYDPNQGYKNIGETMFYSEKKALAAQKKYYESALAKIKKKYNL